MGRLFKDTSNTVWKDTANTFFQDDLSLGKVIAVFEEPYFLSAGAVNIFEESYGLKEGIFFDEIYIITAAVDPVLFEESYGLKLGTNYTEYYGDKPVPILVIDEYYFDAPLSTKRFIEYYNDQIVTAKRFVEPWIIQAAITKVFNEIYGIAGTTIITPFNELYNLTPLNKITKVFNENYYLVSGTAVHQSPSVSVFVTGYGAIDFVSLSLNASLDQYCIIADLELTNADDYQSCISETEITITVESTDYVLFIENKNKQADVNGTKYFIQCISPTAKLDSPYSDTIIKEYSSDVLASTIIDEMAVYESIAVDFQIDDWLINSDAIIIQDETPLAVIKKVTAAIGGIVQTKPNGDLLIISRYPVSPENWDTTIPYGTLSVADDILNLTESLQVNSGYNAYVITDGGSLSDNITLQEETVDGYTKIIKGFQVPFDVTNPFDLATSGGSEITLTKEINPVEEQVPEDTSEWEIVEFIDWTGNVSFPIYSVVDYEWIEEDLGAFDFEEDGTLNIIDTSTVPSESLLRIKYKTKYWKWTATTITSDKYVQFYVEEF
jgi:hypothetical protein